MNACIEAGIDRKDLHPFANNSLYWIHSVFVVVLGEWSIRVQQP
jgi:hypothetical protein